MKLPTYLVRPEDFHIFDLDKTNNRYRSYTTRNVRYPDGTRPNAQEIYTFKLLTENFGFFPIKRNELKVYEAKNKLYHKYQNWASRSDGHGGCKGGTMEEYLERFGDK